MSDSPRGSIWTWMALLAAVVTSAGSVWLSVGMGLVACPLCFYQRTFAMSVVGVLLVGLVCGGRSGAALSVLALPMALAGLGVAGFHVNLELQGTLECPRGVLGLGTAPQQSLAAFVLLTLFLVVSGWGCCTGAQAAESPRWLGLVVALLLGGGFAFGCIRSAPPLPKPPTRAYDAEKEPLKMCRPPYVSPD